MKYLIPIVLLTAFLPNCKKEPVIPYSPVPTDTIPTVDTSHVIGLQQGAVLKNGVEWEVPFVAYYFGGNGKLKFQVRAEISHPGGLNEGLYMQDIPARPGIYKISFWRSTADFNNGVPDGFYSMSAYDEGIGSFHPDSTRTDHYIEVIRCDTVKDEVEARFQLFTGKEGGPSTLPGVPDSVFLTEGKFYLKIRKH